MRPLRMTAYVGGKRYATDKAKVIAHDAFWDGNSEERNGRNQFLFKTEDGSYFVQHRGASTDCFEPAHDWIQPVSQMDAVMIYWELPERPVEYKDAFE